MQGWEEPNQGLCGKDPSPGELPLRLGTFQLTRVLGRGGAGEVWAAKHGPSGLPAAVKMLTRRRAQDARYLALFRREVQVAAAFTHGSIVTLFDYGQVDEQQARESDGRLLPGSPYVAMELVPGGSLSSSAVKRSWPWLLRLLGSVLDALAHVHARGVVHRDIKPGNVLICAGGGAKLSDFGLARPFDDEAATAQPFIWAGTPAYMAPEQIEGRSRDFGPWTDLYALGCLTYFLVSGEPPFGSGDDVQKLADAHRFLPPPALTPRFAVPSGLGLWARRLLMKEVGQRFQCAAETAWELEKLNAQYLARGVTERGPEAEPMERTSTASSGGLETPTLRTKFTRLTLNLSGKRRSARDAPRGTSTCASTGTTRVHVIKRASRDFPADWRTGLAARQRLRPLPPSVGLHALRTIPLAGRDAECDLLWRSLRRVRDRGRAGMVLVRGATGFGKSRLAEWLCHRAMELGVAVSLRAHYGALGSPTDGLRELLVRHLRLHNLARPEAFSRLRVALGALGCSDPAEAEALTELVLPGDAFSETATQVEQHALLLRYLSRLSTERPVVLWLDDVHWGPSAIAFSEYVLENRERLPSSVLLVLTARDETLTKETAEGKALEKLASHPEVHTIDLGPIAAAHRAELVQNGLGLEGELAVRVEERTAGNPLFAVQLVTGWIQRGLLEPSPSGLRLRSRTDVDVPDQLHRVWMDRLREVLLDRPSEDARALAVAAALGKDVDGGEWRAACACAGLRVPEGLVESLLVRRLARQSLDRALGDWSFVHGMLQESIERWARETGLAAPCHLACAEMLESRLSPAVAERLGRHFVLGGAPERAVGPLVLGAFERLEEGDLRTAEAIASDIESALLACNAPLDHPGRCDLDLIRAHLGRSRAEFGAGEEHATRALEAAERGGWPARRARALWERGQMATRRGLWQEGESELREALELSKTLDEQVLFVTCLHSLADSLMMRGDPEAERWYTEAFERAEAIGHRRRATFASLLLSLVAAQTGRLDQALANLERLRDKNHESHETGAWLGTLGVVGQAYADMFRGRIYLEQRRYAEARTTLRQSFEGFALHRRKGEAAAALVGLAVCTAALGQWLEFEDAILLADQYFRETGFIVREVALAATSAGDLAAGAGKRTSAEAAWRLALAMWQALRDKERVLGLELRLGSGIHAPNVA